MLIDVDCTCCSDWPRLWFGYYPNRFLEAWVFCSSAVKGWKQHQLVWSICIHLFPSQIHFSSNFVSTRKNQCSCSPGTFRNIFSGTFQLRLQAAVAGGSSILRFVAPEFASDKVTQWLSHSNTNAMTLTPWGELYIKLLANRTCLCSWSENILHVIHLFRYFYCSFLTANVNSVLVCSHAGYGEYGQTYYIYVLNRIK